MKISIIGSGPAGYTAAIYLGRSGHQPIIIEGLQPGGQLTTTTLVENYPGFPDGIDATQLMDNMRQQAINCGAQIVPNTVVETDLSRQPYTITLDDGQKFTTPVLIIATGATAKYLGLHEEQKYKGLGVSACATCDGFFYRKKIVAVVGGGDTACEEATYLAGLANKVYLIVRKSYLRASHAMQQRVFDNPKIDILFETNVTSLYGNEALEGLKLIHRKGEPDQSTSELAVDGLFLAIGHQPNSELFRPWLQTDEQGYIITQGITPLTNLPGIFAAGDVADPTYRQAINAAASGCRAAIEAERYLQSCI